MTFIRILAKCRRFSFAPPTALKSWPGKSLLPSEKGALATQYIAKRYLWHIAVMAKRFLTPWKVTVRQEARKEQSAVLSSPQRPNCRGRTGQETEEALFFLTHGRRRGPGRNSPVNRKSLTAEYDISIGLRVQLSLITPAKLVRYVRVLQGWAERVLSTHTVRELSGTIIAVNLGECVLPVILSAYLVAKNSLYLRAAAAVLIVTLIVHPIVRMC